MDDEFSTPNSCKKALVKVFDGKAEDGEGDGGGTIWGISVVLLRWGAFPFPYGLVSLVFHSDNVQYFFLYSGQSAWSFCIYSIMLVVRGKT